MFCVLELARITLPRYLRLAPNGGPALSDIESRSESERLHQLKVCIATGSQLPLDISIPALVESHDLHPAPAEIPTQPLSPGPHKNSDHVSASS